MSLIDSGFSSWRKAVAFIGLIAILPLIAIALILKFVLLPFERPRHLSAEEVARYLRDFIEGTGGEWDFDDFISNPIADPRLDSICDRAGRWLDGGDILELQGLLTEAETIVREDREQLVALLRRATIEGDVTGEMIDEALPHPRSLGVREATAYAALSRWADDDDIRAREVAYAEQQRQKLVEQLALLSAPPAPRPA